MEWDSDSHLEAALLLCQSGEHFWMRMQVLERKEVMLQKIGLTSQKKIDKIIKKLFNNSLLIWNKEVM